MRTSVSVCLCTFNGERYLSTQLDSLASQAELPDEVVIGDDGSTDGTVELLEQWAATAPTAVSITRREEPLGHVMNLAGVLSMASSDVVLICDQDDRWHPEKVRSLLLALEAAPGAAGAFSDSALINEAGEPEPGSLWQTLGFSAGEQAAVASGGGLRTLLRRNVVAGHALALRRDRLDLLLPFPELHHADWWLALGLSLTGGIVPLGAQLVDYRLHPRNAVGLRSRTSAVGRVASTRPAERSRADASMLTALVRRIDDSRPGFLRKEDRRLIEAKIAHAAARGSLPRERRSRLLPVAKGVCSGDYKQFSNGWRSALIDIAAPRY